MRQQFPQFFKRILKLKIDDEDYEAYGERFKPAAHDFELCSSGRVLIISLGLPPKTPLTRQLCLQMNALAQALAEK